MKLRRLAVFILASVFGLLSELGAQTDSASPGSSPSPSAKLPIEFDSFILVLLVRPPNPPEFPKEELDRMQEGHFSNMQRLAAEAKLFKAGPTEDYSGRSVRGIFVLKAQSEAEAREWIKDDPLIKAGRLVPELMKWFVEKGSLK